MNAPLPAIQFDGLYKKYGDFMALHPLSLRVEQGEIFGFLGPNGAGKTTTMRVLSGMLLPTGGTVRLNGHDVVKDALAAKSSMGYIPDRPYLYEALSITEFLSFTATLHGVPQAEQEQRMARWLGEFQLWEWRHELIRHLSHGMRQKVVITSALLHDPPVLVVDEPMVGLDAAGVKKLKDIFREHAALGRCVFFSTHSMALAEELCGRIAILHHGQLLAVGTQQELHALANQRVQDHTLEELFLKLTEEEGDSQTA